MSNITDAIDAIAQAQSVLTLLGMKEHAELLDKPMRILNGDEPLSYGTAGNWQVSHLTDESGEWAYLEVYDDDRDDAYEEKGRGIVPIVNVSLSQTEADDLADALKDRNHNR